jgi:hypothetical protein
LFPVTSIENTTTSSGKKSSWLYCQHSAYYPDALANIWYLMQTHEILCPEIDNYIKGKTNK